jgi:tetratricopeptide (TPR) repeat protein
MLTFLIQALLDAESFLQNTHLAEENSSDLADTYYRSSLMTFHLDGERAIGWARKASEIYHICGLEEKEAHAIARMGRIHSELGEYQEALQNYNLALRMFSRIRSPVEKEIRQAIRVCRLWMRSKT